MVDANEFRIELDEFRRHAPRLAELGGQLAGNLEDLIGDLGEVAGKWGGDSFGSAFATNYLPKAEQALGDIAKAAEMFVQLEEKAGAAADLFESTDEGLGGLLDQVRQSIQNNGTNRGKA